MYKIPFNIPLVIGNELSFLKEVIEKRKICGDGYYTSECSKLLAEYLDCKNILLTTSCTHALEMCAILLDIKTGDEIIMPSFTFVSTANAFLLRGAKIVFVDIDPNTMNISPDEIEKNITEKTKLIVIVHYAGAACDLDAIMGISYKYNIPFVEDAAQCIGSFYKGKHLGTFGVMGCLSFHETKNIHCGEGGALIINDNSLLERAEILREKGTNRKKYLSGQVDKYSWVDVGSSYLPSELNAAFLYCQLENIENVNKSRRKIWEEYYSSLSSIKGIELPDGMQVANHNGHIFYIKLASKNLRDELILFLKSKHIQATFHYVPLHSSIAGKKYSYYFSNNDFTTTESERLLRLPIYYGLKINEIDEVCKAIKEFIQTV